MKKSLLLIVLCFVLMISLFAKTEKVVILGIDNDDRDSQYIKTMLEKRDLEALFKGNNVLELVPLKETSKTLKEESFKGTMKEMTVETALNVAKKHNANIAIWLTVTKETQTSFKVYGKLLSLRTNELKDIAFVVSKNKDERMNVLNEQLLNKTVEFATGEIKKMFDISVQNYNNKSYDIALENLLKLQEIDESNPEVYYYSGLVYFDTNQFDKAIESFNKVLSFDPNRENAMLFLSETYKKQGNFDKSIEVLEKVANTKQDDNLWLAIALMYKEKLSNLSKAETSLENAINIKADNEKTRRLLAEITFDNKDYSKAIPHLEFMTNIYPDDDDLGRKLAISYQRTGQLEKAIENYKSLIANNANNKKAFLNLGAAYRAISFEKEADKYNKLALDTYMTVQKLDPDNGKIDVSIADIYLNMNELQKAENFANSAIKKNSEIYEPYVILGTINQKRGIAKHSEYVDLQKKTDSGSLYGAQLDQTIKVRDAAKSSANGLFKKAEELFKSAKTKTDNPTTISDIDAKIQSNSQYINMTKKDFFN